MPALHALRGVPGALADPVGHVRGSLARQPEAHCHVRLNEVKMRVWNAASQMPQ